MFHLNPDHLALVRLLRDRFPHADYIPEGGPALVASVLSLGPEGRVVARVEKLVAGDRRLVCLVETEWVAYTLGSLAESGQQSVTQPSDLLPEPASGA